MVSSHIFSSGSKLRVEAEGPERLLGQIKKSLQGSKTEWRELLGGKKKNSFLPEATSLICSAGKFANQKANRIVLVAIPAYCFMRAHLCNHLLHNV